MKKKFFSLMMALAMALSLAIPAFAGETADTGTTLAGSNAKEATTDLGAYTTTPTVDISLPSGGTNGAEHKVLINPYRLAFTSTAGTTGGSQDGENLDAATAATTNPQIISAPLKITNKTNAPMKIGMKVTATPAANSGITVAAKTMTGKETDKSVFMFTELQYTGTSDTAPATGWTAEADFSDAAKLNEKCFPQVIATETGKTVDIVELVPATSGTTAEYIFFKVLGTASSNPTNAWLTTDTVTVKIVFTFTPVSPYAINCKKPDAAGTGSENATKDTDYSARNWSSGNATTAVTNMPVWVKAPSGKKIDTVTVTDTDGKNPVSATKIDDTLYWFKMPAYNVDLVVKTVAAT